MKHTSFPVKPPYSASKMQFEKRHTPPFQWNPRQWSNSFEISESEENMAAIHPFRKQESNIDHSTLHEILIRTGRTPCFQWNVSSMQWLDPLAWMFYQFSCSDARFLSPSYFSLFDLVSTIGFFVFSTFVSSPPSPSVSPFHWKHGVCVWTIIAIVSQGESWQNEFNETIRMKVRQLTLSVG